jgi:hypothetical protein
LPVLPVRVRRLRALPPLSLRLLPTLALPVGSEPVLLMKLSEVLRLRLLVAACSVLALWTRLQAVWTR